MGNPTNAVLRWAVVWAAAATLGGCAINPVTGERELALISEEQEIALGAQSAEQVARSIGLVDDAALQQYVDRVGQSLAVDSERPELPWSFAVVDDPTPNAFALPGGYIFVTRGLMNMMTSEAELAAVLGHEVAHVTARHSVQQLSRAQLAQIGLGLGSVVSEDIAALGDVVGSGLQLLFLSYGRDAERQADELGFGYMLDQGYEVDEMDDVFQALLRSSELAGRSPLPTWLASHPAEPERIAAVAERIAALPAVPEDLIVGRAEYLQQLDGTVYGSDPRQGYFDGDWFYHPELAFRFRVPSQWSRQNLPSAVQAASPENDAAAQLSLVPAAGPAEAASAFFAQQNIAQLGARRTELNGNPAVISEFRAQAQGGVAHGLVAHIAHGNGVYQLVAYSPEAGFRARAAEIEAIVTSFEPVTRPGRLDVEPQRIDIVELPRAMTFTQFAAQYDSAIPAEELALINQIYDVDDTIPAGTLLKRVQG